jgi:type IV secretion system protein VirD4
MLAGTVDNCLHRVSHAARRAQNVLTDCGQLKTPVGTIEQLVSERTLWGQILCVLAAFAASLVITTQWTAHALGYQSQLGTPDLTLFGYPLYAPWKFFLWWYFYDAYARHVFETGALIFLAGVIISVAIAFGFSLWRSREARDADTYGTARWAGREEIRRLALTTGDGVVLGRFRGEILRHDGDEHVLVVAPTNTGKSVGVSLPTGLVWRHSYIALDLKGENWTVTSGLRAVLRSRVPLCSDRDWRPPLQSAHADPSRRCRSSRCAGPRRHAGRSGRRPARDGATGSCARSSFWSPSSCGRSTRNEQKTLARIAELLADPQTARLDLLEEMLEAQVHQGRRAASLSSLRAPASFSTWRKLSGPASSQRRSGYLALYRDPVLARATEVSDFSIDDIITGATVSLYLVIPPEEISRLKALLRLVLNQILKRLTEFAARQNGAGRRVLLMLDEFPAAREARLLRARPRLHPWLQDQGLPRRPVPEPDCPGLWRALQHPRQCACPRRVRLQ